IGRELPSQIVRVARIYRPLVCRAHKASFGVFDRGVVRERNSSSPFLPRLAAVEQEFTLPFFLKWEESVSRDGDGATIIGEYEVLGRRCKVAQRGTVIVVVLCLI